MAEYPALPLFTDAYLADTRHLTTAQHGAYLLMLMTAWRMPDCCLPEDDIFLARICGMDKRTWASNKDALLVFWDKVVDGSQTKLFQKRLKDERKYVEELRNKNVAAGKASALKRKERHSTTVQPKRNQTSTPTPTPIIPSEGKPSSGNTPPPDWLPKIEWDAFREMRKKIKKPLTAHAEQLAIGKLEQFRAKGHDPTEILNYSIMNDYPNLYEPKGQNNGNYRTEQKSKFQSGLEGIANARAKRLASEQGQT